MRLLYDIILECYAVIAFQVLTAAYWVLCLLRTFDQCYGDPERGTPLLLVHGYMNNPAVFWPLIARLRRAGIAKVHVVTQVPPWGSIESFAAQVGNAVEEIRREAGVEKVDILAHSMGGLAVAYYLKFLGGEERTRKFLAAATSFRGTYLACMGSGVCAFQMYPASRFMRDLDFKAEDVPSTRVYCLRAGFDEYILPNSSASLDHPAVDVRFNHLGHAGLLMDSRSASKIAEVLAS